MRKQLVAAALALFIAAASAFSMFGDVSSASVITLLASAVAAGASLKGAVDARRLQDAGVDPELLTSPLLRKLRAARQRLGK